MMINVRDQYKLGLDARAVWKYEQKLDRLCDSSCRSRLIAYSSDQSARLLQPRVYNRPFSCDVTFFSAAMLEVYPQAVRT